MEESKDPWSVRDRAANVTLDEDEVRRERQVRLSKEKAGIQAAFTRTENLIYCLVKNTESSEDEIQSAFDSLVKIYGSLKDKVGQLKYLVYNDQEEVEKYDNYLKKMSFRLDAVDVCMKHSLQPSAQLDDSVDLYSETAAALPKHLVATSPVKSETPSKPNAMDKKALLQMKLESVRKEKGIKMRMLKLQEEQLKLEHETLEREIEIESQIADAEDERSVNWEETNVAGQLDPFISSVHETANPHPRHLTNRGQTEHFSHLEPVFSTAGRRTLLTSPRRPEDHCPADISQVQLDMQREMLHMLHLPPTQIMTFNGDPLKYWSFIRSFDNSIGETSISDSAKLTRLLQYCVGPAREVIECCVIMEPNLGYNQARKLLMERFGNPFVIAKSWVAKVTEGPVLKPNDSVELRKFADCVRSCVLSLTAMGRLNEIDNQQRMRKIVDKLPLFIQGRWRKEAVNALRREGDYPRIDHLAHFIDTVAEEMDDPIFGVKPANVNPNQSFRRTHSKMNSASAFVVQEDKWTSGDHPTRNCRCCSGSHPLFKCSTFKNMILQDRMNFVKGNKLCFNCFSARHLSSHCLRKSMCDDTTCQQRGRKHSNLLHDHTRSSSSVVTQHQGRQVEASASTQTEPSKSQSMQGSVCGVNGAGGSRIALPIVPVVVKSNRTCVKTYALLDPGSTNSFCSKELVDDLGVTGDDARLALSTLTNTGCESQTKLVSLAVTDMSGNQEVVMRNVFVLPQMPVLDNSSAAQCDIDKWEHMKDIKLPVSDGDASKVTLLIGQDNPTTLIPLEVRSGNNGEPYATRTIFGWAINGPLQCGIQKTIASHYAQVDSDLEQQVERFWTLDHMHDDTLHHSIQDQQVIDLWDSSVERENGYYKLPIPFKNNPPDLPNNFVMVQTRLESLGRKLKKDDNMFTKYKTGFTEMLDKGYAEKVPAEELVTDNPVWYIPHHAVTSPKKPDKVRIVFDCSAKFGDVSLNSAVHQGPNFTNSLIGVLLRFRERKIAIAGDIEAMYHRVKVADHHKDALRFLWWKDGLPGEEIEVYRMNSHLFGGIWSASCANYTLKKVASDYAGDFNEVTVNTVHDNFYVDDCLKSVDTESEAICLIKNVSDLLQKGKFRLTKWISNRKSVIDSVPVEERAKTVKDLGKSDLPVEKALGVVWNTQTDHFGFKCVPKQKPQTKRGLLSIVTSVFDPLGFLSPLILKAKHIFQDESRQHKHWDAPLESANLEKWTTWMSELPSIENVSVPRCVSSDEFANVTQAELHHFADASLVGYGAVSYLRLQNEEQKVKCILLIAKSRLAPIKSITIPRLELCAAALSAKLDQVLLKELRMKIVSSTFWTDSMIVLHYIRNDSQRYQTFVANRVTQIRQASSPDSWRHVRSEDNPADLASRGCSAQELMDNKTWFQGPKFLWCAESEWPETPSSLEIRPEELEVKKAKVNFSSTNDLGSCTDRLVTRFSSWFRLKKAVAWILRLKQCLLKRKKVSLLPIAVDELRDSEIQILKYIQRTSYPVELDALSKDSQLKSGSPLNSLSPFMNSDGLLCVGGRLKYAPVSEEAKHQIILPKHHHVAKLIVREHHESLAHSGTEHVLSSVRQKFWLIKARTTVKGVLRDCVVCRKLYGQCSKQMMADLPQDRVTPSMSPFTNIGVDCFGPFLVKRGRTEVKRYGCVFTCLTTRAIHLEKLDSLDSDSFINALRRFEARRGVPDIIRSDNGTNFRGAERELRESNLLRDRQIHSYMMHKNIKWIFNPPTASHMGGVWERPIRTIRKVLSALLNGQQRLNDEGLSTLFCEIEAIVNSRPITVVSDNHKDIEPLTPNHILLLRSNSVAPGDVCVQDVYRRRWKNIQFLADQFWRRWLKEYLPSLQHRSKWKQPATNFKQGDIVLIANSSVPRFMWPLAKVTKVFTGPDGLVRTVEVKTKNSVLIRPINKLCFLESTKE